MTLGPPWKSRNIYRTLPNLSKDIAPAAVQVIIRRAKFDMAAVLSDMQDKDGKHYRTERLDVK